MKEPSKQYVLMRQLGYVPDDAWYQNNGKTIDENWAEICKKQ